MVVVVLRESVTERRPALHLHRAELQGMCRLISSALLRRGAVHIIPPPHLSLCASVCVCGRDFSLIQKKNLAIHIHTVPGMEQSWLYPMHARHRRADERMHLEDACFADNPLVG